MEIWNIRKVLAAPPELGSRESVPSRACEVKLEAYKGCNFSSVVICTVQISISVSMLVPSLCLLALQMLAVHNKESYCYYLSHKRSALQDHMLGFISHLYANVTCSCMSPLNLIF